MFEVPTTEPSKDFGNPENLEAMAAPTGRYACQCCGNCCKWPGDVRIEPDEIAPIARFLGMSDEDFIQCYTRLRSNRQGLSLMEKENHECIMLEGNTCRIHPAKPEQCRGFPNKWNFPGWRQICSATPVHIDDC
jgi:Fe-S-cluster containining protein